MTIKHLVLPGGGPILIQLLATVQTLEKRGVLRLADIETMYGTSAGAMLSVVLALKMDWETVNDYILKRPWQDVFPLHAGDVVSAFTNKGLFGRNTVEKCVKPLFEACNLPLDLSLRAFAEATHVELHMFAFDLNGYQLEDLSPLTYPDLTVVQALHMTSAIPVLFTPVCLGRKCFIDGGIACNYPLSFCLDSGKDPDEVIGFKVHYLSKSKPTQEEGKEKGKEEGKEKEGKEEKENTKKTEDNDDSNITEDMSLLEYLLAFLFKSVFHMRNHYKPPPLRNEVACNTYRLTMDTFSTAVHSANVRKEWFDMGIADGQIHH